MIIAAKNFYNYKKPNPGKIKCLDPPPLYFFEIWQQLILIIVYIFFYSLESKIALQKNVIVKLKYKNYLKTNKLTHHTENKKQA